MINSFDVALGAAVAVVAYIDPGSGSLLFQVLIAGVLAVSVAFRQARDKVSTVIRRVFRRGGANPDTKSKG